MWEVITNQSGMELFWLIILFLTMMSIPYHIGYIKGYSDCSKDVRELNSKFRDENRF